MARNEIPQNYDPLVSLAEDAADGAQAHGAAIGLSQNTEAKILADLLNLTGDPNAGPPPTPGRQGEWNAAKAAKVAASGAARAAESNARAFCASAVGVLKNYLGPRWNSQWEAAGFTNGSLRMPDDPLPMLGELRAYFLARAAHENAPLGVSAAACLAQVHTVSAARSASNASNVAAGLAKQARDAALRALYTRMSGLLAELDQLLDDDDPRWYAFGFDRPADGEQPGLALNLVLTPGGPGVVIADWDDARRAQRYRVFKQVAGADANPVQVEKCGDGKRIHPHRPAEWRGGENQHRAGERRGGRAGNGGADRGAVGEV
ncbi:MAG TPA: hypothetical protein VIS74_00285 [Chthoniobacterales bacterium]